jgi:preprotein translocase subunit SecA
MAGAGKMGAVTIVTETAGRGYGIHLGGDICYAAGRHLGLERDELGAGLSAAEAGSLLDARKAVAGAIEAGRARVMAAGGLVTIGVFQSGSARADDWVRGLAGQRGEPGESQFFHSSEEYSVVREGGKIVRGETKRNTRPMVVGKSLRGRFLRSAINDVYRNSEAYAFSFQREMAEFDDLADQQRREAYTLRKSILAGPGVGGGTQAELGDVDHGEGDAGHGQAGLGDDLAVPGHVAGGGPGDRVAGDLGHP